MKLLEIIYASGGVYIYDKFKKYNKVLYKINKSKINMEDELKEIIDFNRRHLNNNNFVTKEIEISLGDSIKKGIEVIKKENETNMLDIFIAAINIVLFKYLEKDVNIDIMEMNYITLKSKLDKNDKVKDILKNENKKSKNTKSQILVLVQEFSSKEKDLYKENLKKYDIVFRIIEKKDDIVLKIEYHRNIFKRETIRVIINHIKTLINIIIFNIEIKIKDIDIASKREKKYLEEDINETEKLYYHNRPMHVLFEDNVKKSPQKVAISLDEISITYQELNLKSENMKKKLEERGIKKNSKVAIVINNSIEAVILIIAILKIGAIYTLINAKETKDRISLILEDLMPEILITQNNLIRKNNEEFNVLNIDESEKKYNINNKYNTNITEESNINIDDVFCIMYTEKKYDKVVGVSLMHKNIIRLVKEISYVDISEKDIILDVSDIDTKSFLYSMYLALLNGAHLIMTQGNIKNEEIIQNIVNKKNVNIMHLNTSLFNKITSRRIDIFKNFKKVMFSGEEASIRYTKKFVDMYGKGKLIYFYGEVETGIFSLFYSIDTVYQNQKYIPNGKPLFNTEVIILNNNKKVPMLISGEMSIGQDAVAKNYIKDYGNQEEDFVISMCSREMKMFKTGRIAKFLSSGDVCIKKDTEKIIIEDFEIYPQKIRNHILKNFKYNDCEVLAIKNSRGNNEEICVYIASKSEIKINEIKESISKKFQRKMVPNHIIKLEKIPRDVYGKVITKLLPVVKKKIKVSRSEEIVGEVITTSTEKRFIGIEDEIKNNFTKIVNIYRKNHFDKEIVKDVFNILISKHDALRMIYDFSGKEIIQFNRDSENKSFFEIQVIDCFDKEISEIVTYKDKIISLEKGILTSLKIINHKEGSNLIIEIHDLVCDDISMKIIVKDFLDIYSSILKGNEIIEKEKTMSLREWVFKLKEYGNTDKALDEIPYWYETTKISTRNIKPLHKIKNKDIKFNKEILKVISKEETEKFIKYSDIYDLKREELLLSILSITINKWKGYKEFMVSLKGNMRNKLDKNDTSRTVGCFVKEYPHILKIESENLLEHIENTKKSLRKVKNNGLEFEALKYLSSRCAQNFENSASISFEYNEDINIDFKNEEFDIQKLKIQSNEINKFIFKYVLSFYFNMDNEKLSFKIIYNEEEIEKENILELSYIFTENFRNTIKLFEVYLNNK